MSDIVFTHDDVKKLLRKPNVVLVEGLDEELFIDGKSVCWHERLYPFDVLDALKAYGIINFEYIKE